ncbi:alpha-L-rhamnosidase-related protein [Mangrovibacterium lignilyticum]|uniref:alpha-L-rhamnosidase-related protein n=1 Tax=Mangrovibacterium lignilyticum TaxID=2668052 RepID=UPI0013D101DA|nr:alpha-L-rhamnosidase C-terminal domain-containing protein [Mangrovibacterium lignilyticum]
MKTNRSVHPSRKFASAHFKILILFLFLQAQGVFAQFPPCYSTEMVAKAEVDPLTRIYLAPQRIVWTSPDSLITNPDVLLNKGNSQAFFGSQPICKIINKGDSPSGIILDFGKEIQGGIQITTSQSNRVTRKVRVRLGESVSETSSDVIGDGTTGEAGGATNHHAMRDFELTLPGYGSATVGNTGFRFVRIDLLEPDAFVAIKEVRAVATLRDIPYLGSFKCSDERLNKIWETGAYTVHLCMQDYLWDGIKRDRMVWAGDMHPEIMTINAVFGYNEVVPKTLDFLREHTPLPNFMNGIPSYSMWWVIMQHDWYMYQGRLDYLTEQKGYLLALLDQFTHYVDDDGHEKLENVGMRFMDWPSFDNKEAVHAGLQALMVMTFEKGARLCRFLGEDLKAADYSKLAAKMSENVPDPNKSKQAASLLALSRLMDAAKANQAVIEVGGPQNFSTFFGYYMLQAQAMAGEYRVALDNIRQYWGGMLDLGATTFWEDFDLEEATNAAPIDSVVPEGKLDYHHDTGDYCYIGLRRSLCHGWASGPTAWLSEHVLGVQVLEPGCKKLKIEPHLGDLEWAEGTFPTPMGVVFLRYEKDENGDMTSTVRVPDGIEIVD